jgi:hypothetical protein
VLFAPSTAAPAKLRSPQPQRKLLFKNKSSLRWIEKVFTKLLRQITGKSSAQSYTLCSKPSRRTADDKNVTF